jgi:hypothetical protein
VAAVARRRLALEQRMGPGPIPRLLHLLCRTLLTLGRLQPGADATKAGAPR